MIDFTRYLVSLALIFVASTLVTTPVAGAGESPPPEGDVKGFPGSSPLVIPAAAFSSKGTDPTDTQFLWTDGHLAGTGASGGGCVQAPAFLPDNAEITWFYASYIDNDADDEFWIWLTRTTNTSVTSFLDIATITTSGADPGVESVGVNTIFEPVVSIPEHSYYVSTCLPSSSTKLISVRIYYSNTGLIFSNGFETGSTSGWSAVLP